MKKEKIYKLIDKYMESEFISENDEIVLSLPHINRFINKIYIELKAELADNILPEDFLKPLLIDLVEKFPEIQVSLNYCNYEDEYTVFLRPVSIYNDIYFSRIPEDIFCKFNKNIYFNAIDDDFYFDGIIITGKEYKPKI